MKNSMVSSLNKLSGWLSIHEGIFLYWAAQMIRNIQGTIVEIGSFQGKSTIFLAKSNQEVHAIDPHEGKLDLGTKMSPTLAAFKKNIADFNVASSIILIQKKSSDAVKEWKGGIKLLFIDGLHDDINAQFDYENWTPFLVDGGVVAMHDAFCGWEGAQKVALEQIILNDEYYEVGVVGSIVYGIKGVSTIPTKINRLRIRSCVRLAYWLQKQKTIPSFLIFFLIHRMIKLCMINQFTVGFLFL
ncbi:MAG: class I SAM-dependent methyltransferase [Oligoflexia bacterium]|nr:class I SAM-dependent methyltransferase [Oligoflexia bacterium]